jgi:hypothetical protein
MTVMREKKKRVEKWERKPQSVWNSDPFGFGLLAMLHCGSGIVRTKKKDCGKQLDNFNCDPFEGIQFCT